MKRAFVAIVLVACSGGGRREAASLAEAVSRFHRAENVAKPSAADALRRLRCAAPDVCAAREACVAATEATAKALALSSEVERAMAAIDAGSLTVQSSEAQALPGKLDEAEALLKQGHDAMPACDDKIDALRRTYVF